MAESSSSMRPTKSGLLAPRPSGPADGLEAARRRAGPGPQPATHRPRSAHTSRACSLAGIAGADQTSGGRAGSSRSASPRSRRMFHDREPDHRPTHVAQGGVAGSPGSGPATARPRGWIHSEGTADTVGMQRHRRSHDPSLERGRGRSMTITPPPNGARRPVPAAAAARAAAAVTRAAPDWDLVRKRNNVEKLKFEKHPIRLIDELVQLGEMDYLEITEEDMVRFQ